MIQYRVTNNGLKFYLEEPWIMPNIQQKTLKKAQKTQNATLKTLKSW